MSQPQPVQESPAEELVEIPVNLIHRDPNQPRKHFDEAELKRLAESIDKDGQAMRAVIRPHPEIPGHFMLTAGERRWRAISQYCERVTTLRSILQHLTPKDGSSYRTSFLENAHRRDLYPLELAQALYDLIKDEGLTQAEAARMANLDPGYVNQYLSLLRLHPDVQRFLDPALPEKKRMGVAVALAISRLPQDLQVEVAEYSMERGRRFHDVEAHIDLLANQMGTPQPLKQRRGHKSLKRHMERLRLIMETRFNSYESVNDSYRKYGHVSLDEIIVMIELAKDLGRRVELFASRLEKIRELVEKKVRR